MLKVIFACVHNAGRSQMAAAFFNQLADRTKAEAVSAGTEPGLRVHPEALAVMQEIGIDLGATAPQKLTQELANDAALAKGSLHILLSVRRSALALMVESFLNSSSDLANQGTMPQRIITSSCSPVSRLRRMTG